MKRAVVLAVGKGTRLQPHTAVLPKPLMPIGDGPVLDIVIRATRRCRVRASDRRHRLPGRADRNGAITATTMASYALLLAHVATIRPRRTA
ncbi:MAG: sugar phosphate nucleotidyltransferase [Solirubrobacteraceae bacterium]